MPSIEQAERWLKDRALGKDTFNFAIELKEDAAKMDRPPIIGVVGAFHLPEVGYSRTLTTLFNWNGTDCILRIQCCIQVYHVRSVSLNFG